jgi:hypothetical protein
MIFVVRDNRHRVIHKVRISANMLSKIRSDIAKSKQIIEFPVKLRWDWNRDQVDIQQSFGRPKPSEENKPTSRPKKPKGMSVTEGNFILFGN